jgi:N-acetylglucosaminyl-diphospho-decaprenol L-rhamnosyltransferase
MTGGPEVSVVIVTYNSRGLVGGAIVSAVEAATTAGLSAEILVVDNASVDGTADVVGAEHPDVVLIRNDRNVGYGAANNLAFSRAHGRWWLLLNPDARIGSDSLGRLVESIGADPGLAAVGPSITGAGTGEAESAGELPGLRSFAAHFLFLNRLVPGDRGGPWRGWQLRVRPGNGLRRVGWLSGAAVLLRPEAVRTVGGFDESIFLYAEDVELGYQLDLARWRLAIDAGASASHSIGGSQTPSSARWIIGVEDYLIRRRRTSLARRACLLVIAVGLGTRALAASARPGRAGPGHATRMRAGALVALRRAFATGPPPPTSPLPTAEDPIT